MCKIESTKLEVIIEKGMPDGHEIKFEYMNEQVSVAALTHSLPPSLTRSLTHSLTHSLTCSRSHCVCEHITRVH